MTEFTKRILKTLARLALRTAGQLLGKADPNDPGTRVIETRKTNTRKKQP